MRLTRAMGDVTIGTLIVMVHSAIAERLPRQRAEVGGLRPAIRETRRFSDQRAMSAVSSASRAPSRSPASR